MINNLLKKYPKIKKINYRFNNFVNSHENRLSNFSSEKNRNFFQIKQKK